MSLNIEPDVEKLLRDETHRTRRSLKAVVNEAIRNGLAHQAVAEPSAPYRVKTKSMGLLPGVDPMNLQHL